MLENLKKIPKVYFIIALFICGQANAFQVGELDGTWRLHSATCAGQIVPIDAELVITIRRESGQALYVMNHLTKNVEFGKIDYRPDNRLLFHCSDASELKFPKECRSFLDGEEMYERKGRILKVKNLTADFCPNEEFVEILELAR